MINDRIQGNTQIYTKELTTFIQDVKKLRLPVLINKLIKTTANESYKTYNYYYEAITRIRAKEALLNKYNDKTFMRILRVIIGPYNQHTMEAYNILINERLKAKNIKLTSTEDFHEYLHANQTSLW